MWFVGIDWADRHHDVAVLLPSGQAVTAKRFAHSVAGVSDLIAYIHSLSADLEAIACVIETSQGVLISALLTAGFAVYPVNPVTVHQLRPPSGAKSDASDAYLLARTGRTHWPDLRRLAPDTPLVRELRVLTHDQDSLIEEQTRLLNRLVACLKVYYPVVLQCFTSMNQRVALDFLQAYPTLQQAQSASVEDLLHLFAQGRHARCAERVQQVWALVHGPQLPIDPVVDQAKSRYLLALVGQLIELRHAIAEYDKAIQQVFCQHADAVLFTSLPGAAKRLAPRLLAEWGDDRSRYTDAQQIQALAGTAPVVIQSGTYRHVKMRRACNKPLRRSLTLFAGESLRLEPWAKAYYQRKRGEGKTYAMAIRALANHWVRILYAMWTRRQGYQREIFEHAQQAHAAA